MKKKLIWNRHSTFMLTGAVALVLTGTAIVAKIALAGVIEDPTRGEESSIERKVLDESLKSSKERREAVDLAEVSLTLRMPVEEIRSFLKKEAQSGLSPQGKKAWNRIFKEISIKSGSEAELASAALLADTVSSFIKLKSANLVSDLPMNHADLLDQHSKWTETQKRNFARVLKQAAEIGARDKSVTTQNQAWEKALAKNGLLEKYREGCSL